MIGTSLLRRSGRPVAWVTPSRCQTHSFYPAGLQFAPHGQLQRWQCCACTLPRAIGANGRNGTEPLDAIIVLAGGLLPNGGLPPWVERRLDLSAKLWRGAQRPCPVLCSGGGTPHKPAVLRPNGHVLHEAEACVDHLVGAGLPASKLFKEISSYDTVGNAYFCFTIHAIPAGWRRLAIVTSDFHMPRSEALFTHMASLFGSCLYQQPDRFQLSFHSASDEGIFSAEVLQARRAKEAASLEDWRKVTKRLHTAEELHSWLYSEHLCYAAARQHETPSGLDPKLLASY